MMKVLILGGGGREHALAWRFEQDLEVSQVFVWPGNPGMPFDCVDLDFNYSNFLSFNLKEKLDLVVVGAEKYSFMGVADWCREMALPCLAPSQKASLLEGSKLFSKEIMQAALIPTAPYEEIDLALLKSESYCQEILSKFKGPVIKVSGPAAGKGVFVCKDQQSAQAILRQLAEDPIPGMEDGLFVEEGLKGEEVSVFFACHEEKEIYLGSARDYKRLKDGDEGPNTGGMGCFSPVPWVDEVFIERVREDFLKPTLMEMKKRGTPFTGVLFLGLMVNEEQINLLEYNVRFGDPETQVLLPLIEGELAHAFTSLLEGKVSLLNISKDKAAVHVVKASRGYPGIFSNTIERGLEIQNNLKTQDQVIPFFAAVTKTDQKLVTSGGRVFGLTAIGASLKDARAKVYAALPLIQFSGEHFRRDIGVDE